MGNWPEIFGESGFAGVVASNYRGKEGQKITIVEARHRLMAVINNLVYMTMNGVLGKKTEAGVRRDGKISNKDMSDLQLRGSSDQPGESKDDIRTENIAVAYNLMVQTMVETVLLEIMSFYFKMSKDDLNKLADSLKIEGNPNAREVQLWRSRLERKIKQVMKPQLAEIDFLKMFVEKSKDVDYRNE